MTSQELTPEFLRARDRVLIVTDHSAYDWPWIADHAGLVLDTRNAMRGVMHPRCLIEGTRESLSRDAVIQSFIDRWSFAHGFERVKKSRS
jgi:hypothetical protein